MLTDRARRTPDAPALLVPGTGRLSYGTLYALVRAGIALLLESGVEPGDRVVVPAGDGVDAMVTLLATLCTAVCCPVDPGLAPDAYAALLPRLEPTVVLLGPGGPDGPAGTGGLRRAAGARGVAVLDHDGRLGGPGSAERRLPSGRRVRPAAPVGGPALLCAAGGASSERFVPFTGAGVLASAGAAVRALRLTAADRGLGLDPLFSVRGLVGGLVATLLSGGSLVRLPVFKPGHTLSMLAGLAPTWMSAGPAAHRALLDHAGGRLLRAPRLRFLLSGTAPTPVPLRRELESAFGVPLIESYDVPGGRTPTDPSDTGITGEIAAHGAGPAGRR